MKLVNSAKLDEIRALIDEEVARIAISKNVSRSRARVLLARELGYELYREELLYHEVTSYESIHEMNMFDEIIFDQDAVLADESDLLTSRACIAPTREDADMAALCYIIDSNADVVFGVDEYARCCPKGTMPDMREVYELWESQILLRISGWFPVY